MAGGKDKKIFELMTWSSFFRGLEMFTDILEFLMPILVAVKFAKVVSERPKIKMVYNYTIIISSIRTQRGTR